MGKSAIAKTITADLEREKRLACDLYFNKTVVRDAFSPPHFIPSITSRMAELMPAFRRRWRYPQARGLE
jgi:hypothetical protein